MATLYFVLPGMFPVDPCINCHTIQRAKISQTFQMSETMSLNDFQPIESILNLTKLYKSQSAQDKLIFLHSTNYNHNDS
jgi:hypothetical protein